MDRDARATPACRVAYTWTTRTRTPTAENAVPEGRDVSDPPGPGEKAKSAFGRGSLTPQLPVPVENPVLIECVEVAAASWLG